MYTSDGRTSVQIQFPDSQSSISNDYILNGYEASFGTYEVNEKATRSPAALRDRSREARRTEPHARVPVFGRAPDHAFSSAEERWSTTWERY